MKEYEDKTPDIWELTLCVQTHAANLSMMNQKHKLQEQTANTQQISSYMYKKHDKIIIRK